MGRKKQNSRYQIISARLSDTEMEYIQQIMEATNLSASQLMREAFRVMLERVRSGGMLGTAPLTSGTPGL